MVLRLDPALNNSAAHEDGMWLYDYFCVYCRHNLGHHMRVEVDLGEPGGNAVLSNGLACIPCRSEKGIPRSEIPPICLILAVQQK